MSSEIKVSSVKALDGTAGISIADSTGRVSFTETNPSLTLGTNTTFPAGHVIQTEQFFTGAQWTQTIEEPASVDGNYTQVNDGSNDFKQAITSKMANSKFLVMVTIGSILPHNTGGSFGGSARVNRDISGGTSNVSIGESTGADTPRGAFYIGAGSQTYPYARGVYWQYLDSPSQSSGTTITYKLAVMAHSTGAYTIMFNHHPGGSTSGSYGYQASSSSSLIIQEISV